GRGYAHLQQQGEQEVTNGYSCFHFFAASPRLTLINPPLDVKMAEFAWGRAGNGGRNQPWQRQPNRFATRVPAILLVSPCAQNHDKRRSRRGKLPACEWSRMPRCPHATGASPFMASRGEACRRKRSPWYAAVLTASPRRWCAFTLSA